MNTTISTAKFAALGLFMFSLSCLGQDARLQAQETRHTAKPDFNQTSERPVIKKKNPISLDDENRLNIIGSDHYDTVEVTQIANWIFVYMERNCNTSTHYGWFNAWDVDYVIIRGYGGNDKLSNSSSVTSVIDGGSGNDKLRGGPGNDTLRGGSGDDKLYGGDDRDHLYGDTGDDEIYGGDGQDVLYGGAGDDYLDGGDDYEWVGRGANAEGYPIEDSLTGDSGYDTFINYQFKTLNTGFTHPKGKTQDRIEDFDPADDVEVVR